jgi:hypothetical protein
MGDPGLAALNLALDSNLKSPEKIRTPTPNAKTALTVKEHTISLTDC